MGHRFVWPVFYFREKSGGRLAMAASWQLAPRLSIRGRPLDVIDNNNLDRSLGRLQPQPELLL
jgi:hypothetical protein